MILEYGLGILGWFTVGLLCVGLAGAALLVAEEVRERRVTFKMAMTPLPLYAALPTAATAADVFALAATLRTMDDEFEAWLADRSLCTFDEYCEAVARRRLGDSDDASSRRALRRLLHWGPDWNGNESSGGL